MKKRVGMEAAVSLPDKHVIYVAHNMHAHEGACSQHVEDIDSIRRTERETTMLTSYRTNSCFNNII